MIRSAPRPLRRVLLEGVALAVVAAVVYGLLAQRVFYKIDGPFLVLNLDEGRCTHPYNVAYMPMVCALRTLLQPLGLTAFEVATAFSVLGTAAGVGLAHVAFGRSGLSGVRLAVATALFAATPGIAFFATVVEHHGPFVPFAMLAVWVTIELARRPGFGLAVLGGVATHVAYLVHGTGNLLPGVLLPLFVAWRWEARMLRRDLVVAAVFGGVHLGLFAGLRNLELPGGGVDAALASVVHDGIGQPRGLRFLGTVLWNEWLLPFAPTAVLALAAAARRTVVQREAWALALGLVPYVGICLLLIVGEAEFGAYLLPLAWPAARITALAWRVPVGVLALAVAGAVAGGAIVRHDDAAVQDAWCAALVRATASTPCVVLTGGPQELGYLLAGAPGQERFVPSVAVATVAADPAGIARVAAVFDAYVAAQLAAGRTVLFTAGGQDDVRKLPAGPALLEHVVARHAPVTIEDGVFRAWRLER